MSISNEQQTQDTPNTVAAGCCSAISPCAHQRRDPTTLCEACKLAADVVNAAADAASEWAGDPEQDRAPREVSPLAFRLDAIATRLETLGTLPKPYDLYYAVKNDGVGTGWRYACAHIGVTDIRQAATRVAELEEAINLFLAPRMSVFTDSRAVDDDLVALAGMLTDDTAASLQYLREHAAEKPAPLEITITVEKSDT